MNCTYIQLQTFSPRKVVAETPDFFRPDVPYLIDKVTDVVRDVMYHKLTVRNKRFFDSEGSLYKKNRNMATVAVRHIVMWYLMTKCRYNDTAAGDVFGQDRTTAIHARDVVNSFLNSRADNDYKEIVSQL
jgi:hypothetical protein